eukprot:3062734-Pyramimonas_sp.AAC.1
MRSDAGRYLYPPVPLTLRCVVDIALLALPIDAGRFLHDPTSGAALLTLRRWHEEETLYAARTLLPVTLRS